MIFHTRDDHEAYRIFQRAFAAAETYATLVALKAIMEGMHTLLTVTDLAHEV